MTAEFRRRTRVRGWALVALLAAGAAGAAQEGPSAAELKRMYDDAIGQLKGAQARKNELAAENEKLAGRIAALEKQVKELQVKNTALETDAATWSEKTWQLRATRAAWNGFLARDPVLKARWERYLEAGAVEVTGEPRAELGAELGLNWPFGN